MPERCAVLLRGVNVGRGNRLAMADLRAVLSGLGCTDVVTYLQSGQAVVTAEPAGLADLVARALNLPVQVRTGPELARVVAGNVFPERAATPKQLHDAFLTTDPGELREQHDADELAAGPGCLYLSFAGSSHNSPLVPRLRAWGTGLTARNWTTVLRLAELTG